VASARHGSSLSMAIGAEINVIQARLIAPSANSATIKARQQPRHHASCSSPLRSSPSRPSREPARRNRPASRQREKHAKLLDWGLDHLSTTEGPISYHRPMRSCALRASICACPWIHSRMHSQRDRACCSCRRLGRPERPSRSSADTGSSGCGRARPRVGAFQRRTAASALKSGNRNLVTET
jgi:hypothetical protein